MAVVKIKSPSFRKQLVIEKLPGDATKWRVSAIGFCPLDISAVTIGTAIDTAISVAATMQRDPTLPRRVRRTEPNGNV